MLQLALMKIRRHTSFLLFIFFFFMMLPTVYDAKQMAKERKFSFEYVATVRSIPSDAKVIDLWIPIPHDNKYQRISSLKVSAPYDYKIKDAEYGNKFLHLQVLNPKQTEFNVTVSFDTVRKEHINHLIKKSDVDSVAKEMPDANMSRWLQPDRLVPIDDKIKTWAGEVVQAANAKTDLEKVRAIYNHIIATVKYDKSGTGWGRGDIYYACDARRGNCTDFHAIFIGYCRALGIPARFAIGFPLPSERGEGKISGYHCWAEAYVKGTGWIPVDASEAAKDPARREYFFGAHDENRVEFTIGRDLTLNPKQAGPVLNYSIYPYAEIDGKSFTEVTGSYKYRDLSKPVSIKRETVE